MKPGKVYTLTNPVGNEIFYVGSTNVQLNERLNIHVWNARNKQQGSVGRYMGKLTLKPIIEEIESFDSISLEDLRTAELFWVRQLKALGFPLLNDCRPINDNVSRISELTAEEIEYLKSKRQCLSLVKGHDNLKITGTSLNNIVKTGRCTISLYWHVQYAINSLKKIDWSRVVFKTKAVMIYLSEDQKNRLAILAKGKSKKSYNEMGINYSTISRSLKSGLMRYDKLAHLEQFFGQ
jgi:hypothetical protein